VQRRFVAKCVPPSDVSKIDASGEGCFDGEAFTGGFGQIHPAQKFSGRGGWAGKSSARALYLIHVEERDVGVQEWEQLACERCLSSPIGTTYQDNFRHIRSCS
jgi:hypothetical protein